MKKTSLIISISKYHQMTKKSTSIGTQLKPFYVYPHRTRNITTLFRFNDFQRSSWTTSVFFSGQDLKLHLIIQR